MISGISTILKWIMSGKGSTSLLRTIEQILDRDVTIMVKEVNINRHDGE